MTEQLLGSPVAEELREEVAARVADLRERGTVPTLGTVLMSDDPADERFMELKHVACDEIGIDTRDRRLSTGASASRLSETVAELSDDPAVHAIFIQAPLPDHVPDNAASQRLDPLKDVDCFHPENLGRLVAGDPRFLPATPAAILRLFDTYNISTEGKDVVIVGRTVVGKPLANLLLQDSDSGNATVTVCHSHTRDLGAVTRRGDIVVTACGVPELLDGSMLSSDAVVVDVSTNWRPVEPETALDQPAEETTEYEVVGDVEYESAEEVASAITPVPGGVGPVTLAALLDNVVHAAARKEDADLP